MSRLFLIPLILSILWTVILLRSGKTMYQGRKVYYWIIGVSLVLSIFFSLMIWLTSR